MRRFTFPIYASPAAVHAGRRLLSQAGFPTTSTPGVGSGRTFEVDDDEALGHAVYLMHAIDKVVFNRGPHSPGAKYDTHLIAVMTVCLKADMEMWESLLRLGALEGVYKHLVDELYDDVTNEDLDRAAELVRVSREHLKRFDSPRRARRPR